jgi:hypothetical protein
MANIMNIIDPCAAGRVSGRQGEEGEFVPFSRPCPPYLLYPMLAEFQMHGAKNSLLAAFLYKRNVKIHFLPVMIYYFGLRYSLIVSV